MTTESRLLTMLLALAFGACATGPVDLGMRGERDSSVPDATGMTAPPDAGPAVEACGNGFDDDADARIDEGCSCRMGQEQPCFVGSTAHRGVGLCVAGVQTCNVTEFGDWGDMSCVGHGTPSEDLCDGFDNDCDSVTDESCIVAALEAYIKASNADPGDLFGYAMDLSADGSRLVVGAFREASRFSADENSSASSGAVYVFRRTPEGHWVEEAFLKSQNPDANPQFGESVAISGDGSVLAIGAGGSDGGFGRVETFERVNETWSWQASLSSPNVNANDRFGFSLALSDDGTRLAVVGANPADVYVFRRAQGGHWTNTRTLGVEGYSLSFALGGRLLAVGAPGGHLTPGVTHIFELASGESWRELATLAASNADPGDRFGHSVSFSADGTTLAIGASGESSASREVDGGQGDNSAPGAGAVYIFRQQADGTWSQQAYLKAPNADAGDGFGYHVSLSASGDELAVSAPIEDSRALGLDGDSLDNSASESGAVYIFRRAGSLWSPAGYVKATNGDSGDFFGRDLVLSGDGTTLAVGSYNEASAARGIGGDQSDNSADDSGAVYVYR